MHGFASSLRRSASRAENALQSQSALRNSQCECRCRYLVAEVRLNRPEKMNAMNMRMWHELRDVFATASRDAGVRCVLLSAEGNIFSSGMDLSVFSELLRNLGEESCSARTREGLLRAIRFWQEACSGPEICEVPVVAAVHGGAIGGAVDLLTSCDLRYCSPSASFCVKEIDLAIAADLGTLQRLPKLIGDMQARELAYTGRTVSAAEAERLGLVLQVFHSEEELMSESRKVAETIAKKSPVAMRASKRALVHARDHAVEDALEDMLKMQRVLLSRTLMWFCHQSWSASSLATFASPGNRDHAHIRNTSGTPLKKNKRKNTERCIFCQLSE